MSDDGSASLVGFGEGAGSTMSGPIYQRRPLSQLMPQYNQNNNPSPSGNWLLERQGSGLSDVPPGQRRDRDSYSSVGQASDTPIGPSAIQERRDARMLDGVAPDPVGGALGEDMFIDTTIRSPIPNTLLQQYQQQQLRERQHQAFQALYGPQGQSQGQPQGQPQAQQGSGPPTYVFPGNTVRQSHHQSRTPLQQVQAQPTSGAQLTAARDAERMAQIFDGGETQLPPGSATLGSPDSAGDRLGRFYFEDANRK
jgi:hypothetical protein